MAYTKFEEVKMPYFIVCFDLETQKCSVINTFNYQPTNFFTFHDLFIDSNEVICVQTKKGVQRFPLRFVFR